MTVTKKSLDKDKMLRRLGELLDPVPKFGTDPIPWNVLVEGIRKLPIPILNGLVARVEQLDVRAYEKGSGYGGDE